MFSTSRWIGVALMMLTCAAPAVSSPQDVAQGDSQSLRDRGRSAYAMGNAAFRRGDSQAASRQLEAAISSERLYFATLGDERRAAEAQYFIQYLTLAGVAAYRQNRQAAAYASWSAALDLYRSYLAQFASRLAVADALVEKQQCRSAFTAYSSTLTSSDPVALTSAVRAGKAGHWSEAARALSPISGTTAGDWLSGVVGLCTHHSRISVERVFVAALMDYEPTTSETPNVGPLEASAIRLVLHADGRDKKMVTRRT